MKWHVIVGLTYVVHIVHMPTLFSIILERGELHSWWIQPQVNVLPQLHVVCTIRYMYYTVSLVSGARQTTRANMQSRDNVS